jgi:hypothetical protein
MCNKYKKQKAKSKTKKRREEKESYTDTHACMYHTPKKRMG